MLPASYRCKMPWRKEEENTYLCSLAGVEARVFYNLGMEKAVTVFSDAASGHQLLVMECAGESPYLTSKHACRIAEKILTAFKTFASVRSYYVPASKSEEE